MRADLIYSSGHLRKSTDTIACKYRGASIECPKADFKAELCCRCGWNPIIEQERKERLERRRK